MLNRNHRNAMQTAEVGVWEQLRRGTLNIPRKLAVLTCRLSLKLQHNKRNWWINLGEKLHSKEKDAVVKRTTSETVSNLGMQVGEPPSSIAELLYKKAILVLNTRTFLDIPLLQWTCKEHFRRNLWYREGSAVICLPPLHLVFGYEH